MVKKETPASTSWTSESSLADIVPTPTYALRWPAEGVFAVNASWSEVMVKVDDWNQTNVSWTPFEA